ncbi:MAG: 50S ribosomal protein L11 methyltransferase [Desulfovibrio sp.]|nr:50S ribosomal protein L11 methyltransferase [Desulfovibrio sp.]
MEQDLSQLFEEIGKSFDVCFEPLDIEDTHFEILSIQNMREHLDKMLARHAIKNPLHDLPLWAKVWPGSFVLGRLLRKYQPEGRTLLELGGGCGILSLVASRYDFARIVTSDINEDALRFARANVLHNHLEERITVCRLDVSAPSPEHSNFPSFDLIAASELLYLKELHKPLLKFLGGHLKSDGTALFCTDYARRQSHFAKLAAKYFDCKEGHIGVKSQNAEGEEERRLYTITILQHKSEH